MVQRELTDLSEISSSGHQINEVCLVAWPHRFSALNYQNFYSLAPHLERFFNALWTGYTLDSGHEFGILHCNPKTREGYGPFHMDG